ncbi:hypothetical protein E2C01_040970 [Portunus trituberculatus]|uniref:Uncharacterized protein n=1 Tax=Portunus trituberculatus TaxID=210409 RepID=A0A5B7FPN8_PORTR|nr:hypothetical protein [Portunus trituberculatus]
MLGTKLVKTVAINLLPYIELLHLYDDCLHCRLCVTHVGRHYLSPVTRAQESYGDSTHEAPS